MAWLQPVIPPNFSLPFYHLSNEKSQVWKLITYPGLEQAMTTSNSIKSFSALREFVRYGKLAEEFFLYLQDKVNREVTRAAILEKYFPYQNQTRSNSYEFIEEIELQIVNDDPATYRQRIQTLLHQSSKEEIEAETFVREAAFKRQISQHYNETCSITGLKVEMAINASMIDACHIVNWAESHDDTITNGLSLCPNLHRAFDRGLVSVNNDYQVMLSDNFVESNSPFNLSQFKNQRLLLPTEFKHHPSRENLEWHRKKWGFPN